MAHIAAVAAAVEPPSVEMPTQVPVVWGDRLEQGADIATTERITDGLVSEATGNAGAAGSFAAAEAVRAAMEVTIAPREQPAVLDRAAAARGLRAVISAMAIPAPAPQERARAREVSALLVRKLGKARNGGCSGHGEGLMAPDFPTGVSRLKTAVSDDGPKAKGYLGDLVIFSAGDPGDGEEDKDRGRHSRTPPSVIELLMMRMPSYRASGSDREEWQRWEGRCPHSYP